MSIFYKQLGQGERTLAFSHGLMDSHASFAHAAGELAKPHRIVVYDQRAHGQFGVPEGGYTMQRMAQDLRELIEHLRLERIVLAGYSISGNKKYKEQMKPYYKQRRALQGEAQRPIFHPVHDAYHCVVEGGGNADPARPLITAPSRPQ